MYFIGKNQIRRQSQWAVKQVEMVGVETMWKILLVMINR